MYLVELRPGKEELYRTREELAAAIRKGDVDTHSRIYHRATSKWISVTLHPQYKAIAAERPAAAPPIPPLERTNWTFFNDSADSLAGANDPTPDDRPDDENGGQTDPNHPWRRPLALSITGGLLILGLQLAAAGPKPPWAASQAKMAPAGMTVPAEPAAVPVAPATEEPSPSPVAAPIPRSRPRTVAHDHAGQQRRELDRAQPRLRILEHRRRRDDVSRIPCPRSGRTRAGAARGPAHQERHAAQRGDRAKGPVRSCRRPSSKSAAASVGSFLCRAGPPRTTRRSRGSRAACGWLA